MAGCEISTVYAAISGAHVRGLNSHGIVAVKDKEVREADIARVIEQAKAVAIPMDREVLHVLPQQYIVDDQDGIRDPLGMAGVRLEAKVHIVTTAVASAQNIIKCANRCNLQVADIVLESLASAQAVLEDDEKELGVALIDIGGGTCDMMVYSDGAIVHTSVLPLGGDHITNDIATVPAHAARLGREDQAQVRLRVARPRRGRRDDGGPVGRRPRPARAAAHASSSRSSSRASRRSSSTSRRSSMRCGYFDGLAAGVVLTGGATAMDGVPEIAEQVLGLPARRGAPTKIGGLVDVVRSPSYSTGVGLVMFGADQGRRVAAASTRGRRSHRPVQARLGPPRRDVLINCSAATNRVRRGSTPSAVSSTEMPARGPCATTRRASARSAAHSCMIAASVTAGSAASSASGSAGEPGGLLELMGAAGRGRERLELLGERVSAHVVELAGGRPGRAQRAEGPHHRVAGHPGAAGIENRRGRRARGCHGRRS